MDIIWDWLVRNPFEPLQNICIVAAALLIAIRWQRSGLVLRSELPKIIQCVIATLVFSGLAVIGAYIGAYFDTQNITTPYAKLAMQYRVMIAVLEIAIVLIAGLIGGYKVGLGVLLLTLEHHFLSGFAIFGGIAIVLLIAYVIGIRYFRRQWTDASCQILSVALLGALSQEIMILLFIKPHAPEFAAPLETALFPVVTVNGIGCLLFFWFKWRDAIEERQQNEKKERRDRWLEMRQAKLNEEKAKVQSKAIEFDATRNAKLAIEWELQALRARINPHFLNNTLNDLNALICSSPDQATHYVSELADFFHDTRQFSECRTVSLQAELTQLRRYFDLQRLGLEDKLQECIEVSEHLLGYHILPSSLLTLVENALKHAFVRRSPPYHITISVEDKGEELILRVVDNGCGITNDRLEKLGKEVVISANNKGGGVALHSLTKNLELVFGTTARLTFHSVEYIGTEVCIHQPKLTQSC